MNNIEIINSRISTRTYNNSNLSLKQIEQIKEIVSRERTGLLGNTFSFTLLDISDDKLQNLGKMSSYGIIKGTNLYFGTFCKPEDDYIIDYGYCFEEVILELHSYNISTCWLGGTFGRSFISDALKLPDGCVIPAISPVGISAEKKSFTDKLVRLLARSSKRKESSELFFKNINDSKLEPLNNELLDDRLKLILQAIKVGPSASNKQPWRVVIDQNVLHLYWDKDEKYNASLKDFNIQALDMGIALCHINKVLDDLGIKMNFTRKTPNKILNDWLYIATVTL